MEEDRCDPPEPNEGGDRDERGESTVQVPERAEPILQVVGLFDGSGLALALYVMEDVFEDVLDVLVDGIEIGAREPRFHP